MVKWRTPPTFGRPYPNPWDHGIQSVPEGLPVEVYPTDGEAAEQLHLRVVVNDLARTVEWWAQLGFQPATTAAPVPAKDLWTGDDDHVVSDEAAMVTSDDPSLALRFTTWSGPPPVGPS